MLHTAAIRNYDGEIKMHTEIWRRLGGLLLIALLGSGLARADTVVIGQCAPLSGSLASTGQAMALGVRIAIDAANAAGGVNGQEFDAAAMAALAAGVGRSARQRTTLYGRATLDLAEPTAALCRAATG